LTDIAAALGLSQLARLDTMAAAREARARRYAEHLVESGLILQPVHEGWTSSHHLYVVELPTHVDRTRAFGSLRQAGIGVNVHYFPIHCQPYYQALGFGWGQFPASEAYYRRCLSIPLFPAMTDDQQEQVIAALQQVIEQPQHA
jgi:dTDP-4-amino-4,6-dideoxygalactose transaminase